MDVIAYYRFSDREQAEGTSIARQREDCANFAAAKGWSIIDERRDEGRSAFTGSNRDAGDLGVFEEEVRAGEHHGRTLLVERLDRISRQGFDETSDFVKLLTRNGVSVATVDEAEFYEAGKKLDTLQVIKMLLKAEVAHEESAKKSQRLIRRYELKRAEAQITGKALTKNLPAWLEVGRNGKPKIKGQRDAVIRRIFELADEGAGSLTITRTINAEFEPWTGLNGSTTMQWNRSRITRILKDRQVTGEYQPKSKRNGISVANGEPWPDYFPRIIDHDLFARVQAASEVRQSPVNRRSTAVANLFGGLLRCGHCQSWMLFERKRVAGTIYHSGKYRIKHDEASLTCSNNHFGKGCSNSSSVSYYGFERAMLDACLSVALDDRAFADRDETSRIGAALAEARRTQEIALSKAKALWSAYAETASAMAMIAARDAELEAERLLSSVTALEQQMATAAGKADAEAHLSRIAEFRQHLYHDDLDIRARHRLKASQGFRTVVESIHFDEERSALVRFVGGARIVRIKRGKIVYDLDLAAHHDVAPFAGRNVREDAAIKTLSDRMAKRREET